MAISTGQFAQFSSVNDPSRSGQFVFDEQCQRYSMSTAAGGIRHQADDIYFACNEVDGDFIVRANMAFDGEVDPLTAKIGWLVRQDLTASSPHVFAALLGDGSSVLQFREPGSVITHEYQLNTCQANVIQLERRGDIFTMSAAVHGEIFAVTQVSHLQLMSRVKVGLALNLISAGKNIKAEFSNVRLIKPVRQNFVAYQDYIGSNLEIMDMKDFNRRIVYRDPGSIQAPNWSHDGRQLIYNSSGLLYSYDVSTDRITKINTGFADNNNNDHVLSWDGKKIGISHHNAQDNGHSTIYTLPVAGSDSPKQITATGAGHSYLHGFSPDDCEMVFTAERKNQWDIYKITIENRQETQLTDTQALDDGAEYSPDGKYIYFNSNRTGTMQIWRMDADGRDQKQLTFDKYNDWFPHISPDGKTIVFVSYMDDIDSADHPFYRHVYLRQMPVSGGEPKVIAYVYGGQGTMNVPSWSPDGRYIAFVSNTEFSRG